MGLRVPAIIQRLAVVVVIASRWAFVHDAEITPNFVVIVRRVMKGVVIHVEVGLEPREVVAGDSSCLIFPHSG